MTFSILYDGREEGDDAYAQYAIDWNWQILGQWARSERQGIAVKWETFSGLDEKAYQALLNTFGLNKEQAPLEKIIAMSPKDLAKIGIFDPRSNTIGNHRKASEVE